MSQNYNEISRRGLIRMSHEYDQASNNALKEFLNEHEYESIRPFEQIAQRADEVSAILSEKTDEVSKSMSDRVNSVFDSIVKALTDEVDRCESVLDEQDDDEAYQDDEDEDEE